MPLPCARRLHRGARLPGRVSAVKTVSTEGLSAGPRGRLRAGEHGLKHTGSSPLPLCPRRPALHWGHAAPAGVSRLSVTVVYSHAQSMQEAAAGRVRRLWDREGANKGGRPAKSRPDPEKLLKKALEVKEQGVTHWTTQSQH